MIWNLGGLYMCMSEGMGRTFVVADPPPQISECVHVCLPKHRSKWAKVVRLSVDFITCCQAMPAPRQTDECLSSMVEPSASAVHSSSRGVVIHPVDMIIPQAPETCQNHKSIDARPIIKLWPSGHTYCPRCQSNGTGGYQQLPSTTNNCRQQPATAIR